MKNEKNDANITAYWYVGKQFVHRPLTKAVTAKVKEFFAEGTAGNKIKIGGKNFNKITSLAGYNPSENENHGIVKFLIESGADIDATNKQNKTPFLIASLNDRFESVKLLVEHGANVNLTLTGNPLQNGTALHAAIRSPNFRMVEYLVLHGADVNSKEAFFTPIMMAVIKYSNEKTDEEI